MCFFLVFFVQSFCLMSQCFLSCVLLSSSLTLNLLLNPMPDLVWPFLGEFKVVFFFVRWYIPSYFVPSVNSFLLFLRYLVSWLINSIFIHSFIPQICIQIPSCQALFGTGDSVVNTQAWSALMDLMGTLEGSMSSRTSQASPCLWSELAVLVLSTNGKLYKCPKESQEGRASGIT